MCLQNAFFIKTDFYKEYTESYILPHKVILLQLHIKVTYLYYF